MDEQALLKWIEVGSRNKAERGVLIIFSPGPARHDKCHLRATIRDRMEIITTPVRLYPGKIEDGVILSCYRCRRICLGE